MTRKQPKAIKDKELEQVQGGVWELKQARVTSFKGAGPDLPQDGYTPPIGSGKGS